MPLPSPTVIRVTNGNSGELVINVKAVKNARSYMVRYREEEGPSESSKTSSFMNSRNMRLTGLAKGKTYVLQVQVLGGSQGESDWSDPVSHMAM